MKKRPFTRANRWLLVWVNGTQNSGLVNFVPESRLPFVKISSIYQKTTAKAWTRYQRWLWRNGTRISVLWNIPSRKTGLPFQIFCRCIATGHFPVEWPKKLCAIYFPTWFSGKFWYMVNNKLSRLLSRDRKQNIPRPVGYSMKTFSYR